MHPEVTLVPPDCCLPVYTAMQAEGLVPIVFYDSPVDAANFMELMPSTIMLRMDVQGSLMAAAWLRDVQGKTASLHFCFFRAGRAHAVALGRACLGYVFSTSALQSLYGLTPKVYRAAVRYAQAVGGNILGEVAGACVLHHRGGRIVPGVISTFNPKEYCMGGGGKGGGGGNTLGIMREQMAQQQQMHEDQMAQMEEARASKPQIAKPVTEAATAARRAQKEKASKASGIAGSILTTPLIGVDTDKGKQSAKTLLGH